MALSQILIVVAAVISFVVLVFSYYTITPVFLEIYQLGIDKNCVANAECITIHERQYQVYFVMFGIFLGGFFAALYGRALRRDSIEQSYGGPI